MCLNIFEKFNFTPSYDVVFVLPSLTAGIGGIITVIEIVNGLIRSGIHANIAYIGKKQIDLDLLFEPIYYETFEHFCTFPPESKVFVATLIEPAATRYMKVSWLDCYIMLAEEWLNNEEVRFTNGQL